MKEFRYRLLLGVLKCVALLPTWMLYGVSNLISFVLEHVMKYRRRVIDDNLRTSYPDKDPAELARIRHEFYHHLADVMVETVKLLHISDKELSKRIEIVGEEVIEDAARRGKPVILFLAHYCNWEWVPYITEVFPPGIEGTHVYKPLRDPMSDKLFARIRSRFPSRGLPQKQVVREVLGMHSQGREFVTGFISDHRTNWKGARHHVDFLRHHTPINDIGEGLGRRIGADFVYLDVSKPSRGHYRLEFKPIEPMEDGQPMAYTRAYFKMLEKSIDRQPPYWLWSHRRWLYD